MSGHSKWSKVKHQKAVTDVVKAKAFTKASQGITLAVRLGGGVGDPNSNFHLRLAVEKAHAVNMPKENIERAIDKGKNIGGGDLVQVMYEAYGTGGVAMLIEATTDNANRTVSEIKNLLEHHGATMVAQGAVSYLFKRNGILVIAKNNYKFDDIFVLALDAGAIDVVEMDDFFEIYTEATNLAKVKQLFTQKNIPVDNMEIIMRPNPETQVEGESDNLDSLIELLENQDDVTKVYTNCR
jgi:YebC/PmpR family DNA-binding regulatory protein